MQLDRFTIKAQEAVQAAQALAQKFSHQEIDGEHLMLALLEQTEGLIQPLLQRLGAPPARLAADLEKELNRRAKVQGASSADTFLSSHLKKALDAAQAEAGKLKDDFVSTEHFLLGLLAEGGPALKKIFQTHGIKRDDVLKALAELRGNQRVTDQNPEDKFQALEKYGRDLTALARSGKIDPVIGRDDEIRRVMQVLTRRTKNNPVLIGEPGVGKTAIVEGLARRIVSGDVPEVLRSKRIIALDLGAMLAGAKYRGEFEDRLKAVLKDIEDSQGQIICFIDELHLLVGAGAAEGAMDASNMLKPALARGELRAIGATTLNEYKKHIEKDPALERRFQQIEQELAKLREESSAQKSRWQAEKEAIGKIRKLKENIEQLRAEEQRYERAGDLSRVAEIRYGKIAAAERELQAAEQHMAEVQKHGRMLKEEVDEEDIAKIVSKWTGIPVGRLLEGEAQKLVHMEERLRQRVVGQDDALARV